MNLFKNSKKNLIKEITRLNRLIAKGYDYSGASRRKKSMLGWDAISGNAQEDIEDNLDLLRQRSRDLYMSTPIATSAIKTMRTNVIGEGLTLKARIDADILGIDSEQARAWETKAEKEFKLWADDKWCDATRVNNFYEMQQLAFMSWLLNGDAFACLEYSQLNSLIPYKLRVHLIEGDIIKTPEIGLMNKTQGKAENGNKIFNGVEVDEYGAITAYYIEIEEELKKEYIRIEAINEATGLSNVIQIMESERCDQYRGVPFLAQVIEAIKQVGRYTEAELAAAVITAFFTAFVTTEGNASENVLSNIIGDEDRVSSDPDDYEMGAGVINIMKPGEQIAFADPKRPNSGFDAFITAMTRQIGAALEIPYELLTKSFTSSYSASRGALLEAWKSFRMRRAWFANDFCKPIYEAWLSEAIAMGRIEAPGFLGDPLVRKAWLGSEWVGPSTGQLDPVKEAQAAELRVKNGFSTRERETTEITGGNWEQNMRQLEIEDEKLNNLMTQQEPEAEEVFEFEQQLLSD